MKKNIRNYFVLIAVISISVACASKTTSVDFSTPKPLPSQTYILQPTISTSFTPTFTYTPTDTPTPTITYTPTASPTVTQTPIGGGSGKIYYRSKGGLYSITVNERIENFVMEFGFHQFKQELTRTGDELAYVGKGEREYCKLDLISIKTKCEAIGFGIVGLSPSGDRFLAKDDMNSMYYIRAFGSSSKVELPFSEFGFGAPIWSPDANKVGGIEWDGHYRSLFVVSLPSLISKQVTKGSAVTAATWSHHSSLIAYSKGIIGNEIRDLFIINEDGTGEKRLTYDNAFVSANSWSPDDSKILYALSGGAYSNWTQLKIYDFVMEKSYALTANLNLGPSWNSIKFSWSPDGTMIAFIGDPDRNDINELYIINTDGSDQRLLVEDNCLSVIWSR